MTGEELYNLYMTTMEEKINCDGDAWVDIDSRDQQVWNALADKISHKHAAEISELSS